MAQKSLKFNNIPEFNKNSTIETFSKKNVIVKSLSKNEVEIKEEIITITN